jgi:hypothetical protein
MRPARPFRPHHTAFFKLDDCNGSGVNNINPFQYQDNNGVNLVQAANNVVLGC